MGCHLSSAASNRNAVRLGVRCVESVRVVHYEAAKRLERPCVLGPVPDPSGPGGEPGAYFYDADPAAVRAHTLGALGERHGLRPVGDSNGYLTGASLVSSPWLVAYETIHTGPGDIKRTREALRRLGAGKRAGAGAYAGARSGAGARRRLEAHAAAPGPAAPR